MSGALWVEIVRTRGSTPRDAGTAMKVTAEGAEGTIGGGALEWRAMETARAMLSDGAAEREETWPLGPGLGQCCGGAVTLRFTRERRAVDPVPLLPAAQDAGPGLDLWLWGAGHVGRAIVRAAPARVRITWADTAADRFPEWAARRARVLPAADLPLLAARAPVQAHHLIMTYSHDIDLALCDALLRRGFASCGLIGSDTKWARFRSRLRQLGHDDAHISGIACPIGDKALGKRPEAIAAGTVAALLRSAGTDVRQGDGAA
ncbi:xanthine dehydrogenase accessory protein XdhC [Wenxinia marina]|uniref:Molybdenum cofactor sulfurylase n=1 Tax=Wenxinia marina DSM 24838 TaxID=1123501 RepID=A0A0D0Q4X9_9RHOB|nr:xanthine dehydrogenase accessory protein XdhC [Wenxinia marina]KIQ67582.1 molybdenum cofactor sulfurylase [Wenxinia marina DSM 24838]GGL68298.1 xanthine dehydrogenase accessory protein XdhC [Wenxinia marina]